MKAGAAFLCACIGQASRGSAESRPLLLRRVELVQGHLERLGQRLEFTVGHTPELGPDLGEGCAAHVQAQHLTAGGQHCLRHVLLVAQLPHLRPDDVLHVGHAPILELDPSAKPVVICSDIGALIGTALSGRNPQDMYGRT